jgi:predicted SAM-dependent methyltransferase
MKDQRILNLGCGNDTYGTDRIDMYKTDSTTIVYDITKGLPFEYDCFDEVYCKSILEHLKDLNTFEKEVYRVLKPNGKLFIRTDFAGYLPMYLFKSHEHNQMLKHHYQSESYDHEQIEDAHYHLFVESHLRILFKRFRNIEINYICSGRNKIINFILNLLPFNMGMIHIELRAEK